jgi:hypothetical protein
LRRASHFYVRHGANDSASLTASIDSVRFCCAVLKKPQLGLPRAKTRRLVRRGRLLVVRRMLDAGSDGRHGDRADDEMLTGEDVRTQQPVELHQPS